MTSKADASTTGDAFVLAEGILHPGGSTPPLRLHRELAECLSPRRSSRPAGRRRPPDRRTGDVVGDGRLDDVGRGDRLRGVEDRDVRPEWIGCGRRCVGGCTGRAGACRAADWAPIPRLATAAPAAARHPIVRRERTHWGERHLSSNICLSECPSKRGSPVRSQPLLQPRAEARPVASDQRDAGVGGTSTTLGRLERRPGRTGASAD
jgi:hypothetical protein